MRRITPKSYLCEHGVARTVSAERQGMNILSLLENQISSPAVGRISNALGESPEGVKSAMGGAFPALLGSLLGKVKESPNGAGEIFNMLKQGSGQGAWPEKIEDAASAVGSSAAQPAQHSLLTSLLGPKLGA